MKRAILVILLIAGMGLILWPQQSQPAEAGMGWVEDELPPRPTPPRETPISPPTSPPAHTATPRPDDTPTPPPVATATPPPGSTPTTPPISTATPPPGSIPTATPRGSSKGGGSKGSGGGAASDMLITGLNTTYQTQPGAVIDLAATVRNEGRGVAKDAQVTSTLPPFLQLVGVTSSWGTVHTTEQTFRVDLGQLMPNDEVRIHIQARVISHTIPPYNKYAMIVSSQNDENPDNNIARFIFWTFNQ